MLRAVLQTLRDRISMSESLDLMSQLPAAPKIVYVEDWKMSTREIVETILSRVMVRVSDGQKRHILD